MRSIMSGIVPTAAAKTPSRRAQLVEFEDAAIGRWEARVSKLPADAAPRFLYGHYDVGLAVDGAFNVKTLSELREIIATAVRNHSGWPPFLTLNRAPFAPKPIDGAVEFWRGPDSDGSYAEPAHHDFWRVSPDGLLFTRRGYQEDGGYAQEMGLAPGRFFDINSASRRLGEAILEAFYIAQALEAADANLICHGRWIGLSGRRLTTLGNPNRTLFDKYDAEQNTYEAMQTVALHALPHALPEVIYSMLAPLYELFEFFRLPKRLVEEELASLQKNVF
jgi:hypothetical protein